jgi:hypothetical protein
MSQEGQKPTRPSTFPAMAFLFVEIAACIFNDRTPGDAVNAKIDSEFRERGRSPTLQILEQRFGTNFAEANPETCQVLSPVQLGDSILT